MTAPVRTNPNTNTNAVARGNSPASALEPFKTASARRLIEAVLPTGVSFERIMAEVYFAVQKTPKLAQCSPESLVMSVAQCVKWDLEIGVKCHLVPYGAECTPVRDYKGDAELVVRCGAARYVDAQNVYANEEFEYEQGTHPFIRHRPMFDKAKRGKWVASYAVAKVNSIDIKIVVMGIDDIETVRQKYSKQWKTGALEDIPWYGPKTCVHRVVKLLPSSPKLAKVLAEFEDEERIADAPARTELPVVDVMRQLESGDGAPSPVDVGEAEANIRPEAQSANTRREVSAAPAPIDEVARGEDAPDEPTIPARSAAELWKMPFGGSFVGKPIGDVPTVALKELLVWARKSQPTHEFIDRAAQILDDRRLGDAQEPTQVTGDGQ